MLTHHHHHPKPTVWWCAYKWNSLGLSALIKHLLHAKLLKSLPSQASRKDNLTNSSLPYEPTDILLIAGNLIRYSVSLRAFFVCVHTKPSQNVMA